MVAGRADVPPRGRRTPDDEAVGGVADPIPSGRSAFVTVWIRSDSGAQLVAPRRCRRAPSRREREAEARRSAAAPRRARSLSPSARRTRPEVGDRLPPDEAVVEEIRAPIRRGRRAGCPGRLTPTPRPRREPGNKVAARRTAPQRRSRRAPSAAVARALDGPDLDPAGARSTRAPAARSTAGVVARLTAQHGRRAGCVQAREEDTRLHLRA